MRRTLIIFAALFLVGFGASGAIGATVDVQEWTFNIDGHVTDWMFPDPAAPFPAGVGGTLTNGLGTLTWSTSSAGAHTFVAFFDHEIDQEINTYFNEFGTVHGAPAAGLSYQLGDPYTSSIFTNVSNGILDNSNTVASGLNDVSMALGWTFTLAPGETGAITLNLFDILERQPAFYLSQTDPDSQYSIYFTGELNIRGGGTNPVPEPGTFMLLAVGLAGLTGWTRRKVRS